MRKNKRIKNYRGQIHTAATKKTNQNDEKKCTESANNGCEFKKTHTNTIQNQRQRTTPSRICMWPLHVCAAAHRPRMANAINRKQIQLKEK